MSITKKDIAVGTALTVIMVISAVNCVKSLSAGARVDDISAQVYNQTAIVNRIVGENIPVVVPEKDKADFQNVIKASESAVKKGDVSSVKKARELYTAFIRTTAPWIQESLADQINQVRFDLSFAEVKAQLKETGDYDKALAALEQLIQESNGADSLKDVQLFKEKTEADSKVAWKKKLTEVKKQVSEQLNPKSDKEKILALMKIAAPYENDEAFADTVKLLNEYMKEAETLSQIKTEVGKLKKNAESEAVSGIESESWNLYSSRLSQLQYELTSIKKLDVTAVKADLADCSTSVKNFEKSAKKSQNQTYLKQMAESLTECKSEIASLKFDVTFNASATLIASQLASFKHEAVALKNVDNQSVLQEIDNCILMLNNQEQEYKKLVSARESIEVKNYNTKSLNLISDVKKRAGDISMMSSDKKQKRLGLLLELESLQTNCLYQPVVSLYQEVYADIWSGLDADTRFEFAKQSITIEKRGLNENF